MNTSHLISSTKCENMSSHGAKRKLCGWMVDAQPCETAAKPRETRAKRAKHPAKRPRNTRETSRNMRETQRILCEFDANPCSGPAAPRVNNQWRNAQPRRIDDVHSFRACYNETYEYRTRPLALKAVAPAAPKAKSSINMAYKVSTR